MKLSFHSRRAVAEAHRASHCETAAECIGAPNALSAWRVTRSALRVVGSWPAGPRTIPLQGLHAAASVADSAVFRWKSAGAAERRERRLADLLADPAAGLDQRAEVVAVLEAGALQHIDQVLGGDVAGGGGRERAAAEAAATGVEHLDAGFNRGAGVGQASATGVVEMHPQPDVRRGLAHRLDPPAHGPGISDADGVDQRDLRHAQRAGLAGQGDDLVLADLALERTAERDREGDADRRSALGLPALGDGRQRFICAFTGAPWLRMPKLSLAQTTTLASSAASGTAVSFCSPSRAPSSTISMKRLMRAPSRSIA